MPPEKEKSDVLVPSAQSLVVGEVVEAIKQDKSGQINVNILIQQASEKTRNSAEMLEATEKALAIAEKWDRQRIQSFRERVEAVIDAKMRDPDEVEKRKANKVRRGLKILMGGLAIAVLGAGIVSLVLGKSLVIVTLLLLIGAVAVAMIGPLASGESVSANDVVQIISSMGKLIPLSKQDNDGGKKKK